MKFPLKLIYLFLTCMGLALLTIDVPAHTNENWALAKKGLIATGSISAYLADTIPGTTVPLSNEDVLQCQTNVQGDFRITELLVTGSGNRVRITIKADVPPREAAAIAYRIERSENNGSYATVRDAFQPEYLYPYGEFIDDNLNLGSTYSYRVTPLLDGNPAGSTTSSSVSLDGTVYYFSTSGSDNNNGRSRESPFRSLAKMEDIEAQPGDLFRLRAGDRFELSNELFLDGKGRGTAENPIVLTSYGSGAKPHIITNDKRVFGLRTSRHFHVDNVKFSGAYGAQIQVYAYRSDVHGIKFLRIEVDGSKSREGSACLEFNAQNATILGPPENQQYHVYDVEIANSTFSDAGGRSGNSDAIRFWAVRNNGHVHHSSFYRNAGEATDIAGGADHIFEYNYVDCQGVSRAGGTKAHGQRYSLQRTIYRFNIIKDCGRIGISLEDSADGLVYHNTIDMPNRGFGVFVLYGKNRPEEISNNRIFNNIFRGGFEDYGPITVYINGAPTDSRGKFKNFRVDYVGLNWRNGKEIFVDNNLLSPSEDCPIRYVFQETDLSYSSDYPENNGPRVPVCVPQRDFGERWAIYHPNDQIGNPSFNRTGMSGYRLRPNSPGVGLAKDIRGFVGENLRDYGNQPILYSGGSSNVGAHAYSED